MKKGIKLGTNFQIDMNDFINNLALKTQNISALLGSYIDYCKGKLLNKPSYLGKKRIKFISHRLSYYPNNTTNTNTNTNTNTISNKAIMSRNTINTDPNAMHSNRMSTRQQRRILKRPKITGKVFQVNCIKGGKVISGYRLLMKYNKLKFYVGPYEDEMLVKVMNNAIQKGIRTLVCTQDNYFEIIGDCVKEIKKALNENYTMLTLFKSSKQNNIKALKKIGHFNKDKGIENKYKGKENKDKSIGHQYMSELFKVNRYEAEEDNDDDK